MLITAANKQTPNPSNADRPEHARFEITRVRAHARQTDLDAVAIEEPLEIRLEYGPATLRTKRSISITMRTPGHDFELAAGFLFSEGIVRDPRDIECVRYCGPDLAHQPLTNVVRVELRPAVAFDIEKLNRHFYTSSSCGVCGKSSIEALKTQSHFPLAPPTKGDLQFSASLFHSLPARLRESQGTFEATGGIHASALFSPEGELLISREDVGRHNALDKLVGHALLGGFLPFKNAILMLSGRASFELVQKASMAGFSIIAAVGAPSSLAIELARECGITLLGFVRNQGFNVYSHESRIRFEGGTS